MFNLPNVLTLFRIVCIPLIVGVFYLPVDWSPYFAACLFALACFTDWLDGYLARVLNQTSQIGAFLDPVADKLIVSVCLVLLVADPLLPYLALPAAVIISREIVISALREWMSELGKRQRVAVSLIGKIKTASQMTSITILLAFHRDQNWGVYIGYVFLYLSSILTIWSMFVYLKSAWRELSHAD